MSYPWCAVQVPRPAVTRWRIHRNGSLATATTQQQTTQRQNRRTAMEGGRLDCQQMVELVTDYLEDALPPALRIAFDEHIRDCDGCQAYLAQMRSTVDTLRSV